jgi:alpha-tubulin suppressor-like RCC1 family protein
MTGKAPRSRVTAATRWRPRPGRPATARAAGVFAAALAVPALAVPALAMAGSSAAAASTVTAADKISAGRISAGRLSPGSDALAGTAASTASKFVLAWGRNDFGQLGNGTTTGSDTPVNVTLPAGRKVTQVRAGCSHTLALTSKGHVLAWGANDNGQLGDGSTTSRDTPVRVKFASGTEVTAISAGDNFSLARTSKHHALAWGLNSDGQLGTGSTVSRHTPVRVKLPRSAKVKALAAGSKHGLARTSAGLYAWGNNFSGQLGNGSTTSSDRPVKVDLQGLHPGHVTSLFAGCDFSLALFSRGALLAWGNNLEGQLGDGSTVSRSDTPVEVMLPAGTKVRSVSAGCVDGYALTVKGHVLAWGYNGNGQLGNGTVTDSGVPVRVSLPAGWRASAVGSGPLAFHALAIVHLLHPCDRISAATPRRAGHPATC